MNLFKLPYYQIREKLIKKEISCQELFSEFLSYGQKTNELLNAYISFNEEGIEKAKKLDEKLSKTKDVGKLFGLPIGIKDMILTEGLSTTAASLMLKDFKAPYSASLIHNLEDEDALILGKCNQDEFAMGSSNRHSYFGPCKNPWNEDYVSGGSSGGSASAVASFMNPVSLGTDTGGSVRQPAHFCGVLGMKPTYGRISRYGVIAFASSLDQVGVFSRNTQDLALTLETVAGFDPKDATTFSTPTPQWSKNLSTDVKGLKIGIIKNFLKKELEPANLKAIEEVKKYLTQSGATVEEVEIDYLQYSVPVYYLISTAEASSNLARYDGVRFGYRSSKESFEDILDFYCTNRGEGFGLEVKRRLLTGSFVLSKGHYDAYYGKAVSLRKAITKEFMKAFKNYDCLLSPVSLSSAFRQDKKSKNIVEDYSNDQFTVSVNLASLPGLTVPVLKNENNLPVGVQFIAPHFREDTLFNLSYGLEKHFMFEKELENVVGKRYWA